jgi:hypothetical protein
MIRHKDFVNKSFCNNINSIFNQILDAIPGSFQVAYLLIYSIFISQAVW